VSRYVGFLGWNVLGQILPLGVAFLAYPILLHRTGVERLGLLTLAWSLIGYLGLLDFGLTRVLARRVAAAHGRQTLAQEVPLVHAVLAICLSAILALSFLGIAWHPGGIPGMQVPDGLWHEASAALPWLLIALPPTLLISLLTGVLEGCEEFKRLSLLRMAMGTWNYAGPVIVSLWTPSVAMLIAAVAAGRWIGALAYLYAAGRILPGFWQVDRMQPAPWPALRSALKEGFWVAVSNVIGPIMMFLDRYVVAALLSLSMVAYYSTPYDAVSRVLIFPMALMGAVFPAFARLRDQSSAALPQAYVRTLRVTLAAMLPACTFIIVIAHDLLRLWLGDTFAARSEHVMQIFAVAMLVNALAHVPYGLLQSAGRSDLTAKCHLLELPVYALALLVLCREFGIVGVAIAWGLRVGIDLVLLWSLSGRFVRVTAPPFSLQAVIAAALILAAGFGASQVPEPHLRAVLALVTMLGAVAAAWGLVLTPQERSEAGAILAQRLKRTAS
jgi:O-antigen/teichoic acid export membrane protein